MLSKDTLISLFFLYRGSKAKCFACEVVVESLQLLVRSNVSQFEIAKLIEEACNLFHVETERVCGVRLRSVPFATVHFKMFLMTLHSFQQSL